MFGELDGVFVCFVFDVILVVNFCEFCNWDMVIFKDFVILVVDNVICLFVNLNINFVGFVVEDIGR